MWRCFSQPAHTNKRGYLFASPVGCRRPLRGRFSGADSASWLANQFLAARGGWNYCLGLKRYGGLALRLGTGEGLNDMTWVQHQAIEITPALFRH